MHCFTQMWSSLSKKYLLPPVLVFSMFEVSVRWHSLSSLTGECTIWTWQSITFLHKIWDIYFYTFTTNLYCPCKPWEFSVCRLSCLFACKRNNDADKYFKCNKIHKTHLSINYFTYHNLIYLWEKKYHKKYLLTAFYLSRLLTFSNVEEYTLLLCFTKNYLRNLSRTFCFVIWMNC